jgi:hypothetical protein
MNIKTKVLLFSTLFAILLVSCKKNGIDKLATEKERSNEHRFFQINGNINSAILQINKSLREQNQKTPFISKFTKLAGYPKWDKGFFLPKRSSNQPIRTQTTFADSTFIIPVVSENDRVVTGAIIAKIDDSSSYHLVLLKDYQSFNNEKATFIKAMMILDAKVYGYNNFTVEDTSAINGTKEVFFSKHASSFQSNRTSSGNYDDPCEIIEIWYDPDGDADPCDCSGNEYYAGEWYYADEANCFSTTPQPVLSFLLADGGGYQLPNGYYTLPDLSVGSGGGSTNPPYTPIPFTEQQKQTYLVELLDLNPTEEFYLVNTADLTSKLFEFLYDNNEFTHFNYIRELINWIATDPTATTNDMKYFLQVPESEDGVYDSTYWENSNTVFQQIELPTLQQFTQSFPKITTANGGIRYMPSDSVYRMVGGSLGAKYNQPNYKNACAIRGSWAFNKIQVGNTYPFKIPTGSGNIEYGANNLPYIVNAKGFNAFMHKKFGNPTHTITNTQIGGSRTALNNFLKNLRSQNIHGIYTLVTSSGSYSGHVDLMTFGDCLGGYALPENISVIEKIEIWQLQ